MDDYEQWDYDYGITAEAYKRIQRKYAESSRYKSFLRRRDGFFSSFGYGEDGDGDWFEIRKCGIDRQNKTLEEFEAYQRVRLAMCEPDNALELWIEIRFGNKAAIVIKGEFDPHEYCRTHGLILRGLE